MKLGFNDTEETFDYAIRINRCIEFIYKRKRYWIDMLEVDGVYPSNETIQNGTYPLVTTLYCITAKDNDNPYVQKVLDFLLSEDGQSLVEMTGYSPLN